jgi:hypothetical protein
MLYYLKTSRLWFSMIPRIINAKVQGKQNLIFNNKKSMNTHNRGWQERPLTTTIKHSKNNNN